MSVEAAIEKLSRGDDEKKKKKNHLEISPTARVLGDRSRNTEREQRDKGLDHHSVDMGGVRGS